MKRSLRYIIVLLTLFAAPVVHSGIVVNEAMVNEPGSNTSLEWIELYNNSASVGFINSHHLVIGSNTITFDSTLRLQPYQYYIIYRRLFGDVNSEGFESVWGNNSGVWGDTPKESEIRIHYQNETFSLPNSGGKIQLFNAFNILVSELDWTSAGQDGVSYEREYPDSAYILQCIDTTGSTPGYVNSVTPVSNDLSLEQIDIAHFGMNTNLFFHIVNRCIDTVSGSQMYLFRYPGPFNTPTDTLDIFNLPDAVPGFTFLIGGSYTLNSIYDTLLAQLSDDDRPQNNKIIFVAPGMDFPPLLINEYLANPAGGLESEWVEVKNISGSAINLQGWKIGDALSLNTITDSVYYLYPNEYLVLTDDTLDFLNYYAGHNGLLLQTNSWSALNNNGDQVRLKDNNGLTVDSLQYASSYSDNHTWAIAETGVNAGSWGRSEVEGGSPGAMNRVVFNSVGDNVRITITPEHFAPESGGLDDHVDIQLEAPESDSYSLTIFDRHGREVRKLLDNGAFFSPNYTWDGRDEDGNRLPIGIYIVIFEVPGVQDVRKTVVIAR